MVSTVPRKGTIGLVVSQGVAELLRKTFALASLDCGVGYEVTRQVLSALVVLRATLVIVKTVQFLHGESLRAGDIVCIARSGPKVNYRVWFEGIEPKMGVTRATRFTRQ